MPKITAKFIEADVTFPTTGQLIIRDNELKGFALRVTKGRITFVAECSAKGKRRRVTLGRYGAMTPEEARTAARKLLSGTIAIQKITSKVSTIKLNDVFQKFLAVRKLRPNTIRNFTQITKQCLGIGLTCL